MRIPNRAAAVAGVGLAIAMSPMAVTAPASAGVVAQPVTTNRPGNLASCNYVPDHPAWDGAWVFQINGITDGVTAPASVTAALVGGGTATVPLSETTGDSGFYPYSGASAPTGDASTAIDGPWNPATNLFALLSKPCVRPTLTAKVSADRIPLGQPLNISGNLSVGGVPQAGVGIEVAFAVAGDPKSHSLPGPQLTDAGGNYSVTVPANATGRWSVLYGGSRDVFVATQAADVVVAYPPTRPPLAGLLASSAGSALRPGATTTVSGTGFAPYSWVAVLVYSSVKPVATVEASETGSFAVEICLPKDLPEGRHTLVAAGLNAAGEATYLGGPVTVTAEGAGGVAGTAAPAPAGAVLARTGFAAGTVAGVAVVLIVAGLAAVGLARRRRRRPATLTRRPSTR